MLGKGEGRRKGVEKRRDYVMGRQILKIVVCKVMGILVISSGEGIGLGGLF